MMELKDWILLLIPLICNGLILFFVQQSFSTMLKRREEKHDYQKNILQETTMLFQKFFADFHQLRNGYYDPKRLVPFAQVWNPLNDDIRTLVVFYDAHPLVLKKSKEVFDKITHQWNFMGSVVLEQRETTNCMDDEFREKFNQECYIMQELARECLVVLEKELLDL